MNKQENESGTLFTKAADSTLPKSRGSKKSEKALTIHTEEAPVNQQALVSSPDPSRFMEMALANNASIETLERLMTLYNQFEAKKAERAFNEALAAFQEECPEIIKTKAGYENRYKYAPLGQIDAQIKGPLAKHGLNKRWEFEDSMDKDGKPVVDVICVVTHKDGHSQRTRMRAGHDDSGKKTAIQAHGSSLTYQQRYTLIGALGLTTTDNDHDGRREGNQERKKEPIPQARMDDAIKAISKGKATIEDVEAVYILTEDQKKTLEDLQSKKA